ncbi:MAG: 2-amino-4-hydroxy-6-hydroxymethyldihydropteridine diphosphokinase [Porticoccaceae bacterium]|nr:2-amino-4-hydroxy-6-hydroxymethyldihydropteridine diphosphokinase [Pseudomonadales bacterium]MCP5173462.1 2-amino-4-hydroxy-6-hydroxymethyldihydropteridine diphosphokinase [Pseudomonadales bacterium]MCP5303275.1 2-amino-4-hydroxy-6-hydroxymethyldihydropteridine diphosphokinase [Pseudomonadales bacterium]
MAKVFLSLGSNIDRRQHISSALDALHQQFGELLISSVYESEAVGFVGDNFYNLVVGLETDLGVGDLSLCLKKIEDENGRRRDCPKFSARTLDIDILSCGQMVGRVEGIELPRREILENAFVLLPLAELVPEDIHPVVGKSYSQLWNDYEQGAQKLWPVDFSWCDRLISRSDSSPCI